MIIRNSLIWWITFCVLWFNHKMTCGIKRCPLKSKMLIQSINVYSVCFHEMLVRVSPTCTVAKNSRYKNSCQCVIGGLSRVTRTLYLEGEIFVLPSLDPSISYRRTDCWPRLSFLRCGLSLISPFHLQPPVAPMRRTRTKRDLPPRTKESRW